EGHGEASPTPRRGGRDDAVASRSSEPPLEEKRMARPVPVSITVNGRVREGSLEPRVLLVHYLREQLNLTGTHVGCDTSQCGACTGYQHIVNAVQAAAARG